MIPALLISRSSLRWANSAENSRTESRLPSSRALTSGFGFPVSAAMSAAAASPFPTFRHASTTSAPWRTSSVASTRPSPLLAPVTTASLPLWSGIRSAFHLSLIRSSLPASVFGKELDPREVDAEVVDPAQARARAAATNSSSTRLSVRRAQRSETRAGSALTTTARRPRGPGHTGLPVFDAHER